jgi:hypothetical protein
VAVAAKFQAIGAEAKEHFSEQADVRLMGLLELLLLSCRYFGGPITSADELNREGHH